MASPAKSTYVDIPCTLKLCQKLSTRYLEFNSDIEMLKVLGAFAAANWPRLEPLFLAQVKYAAAEGLSVPQLWNAMANLKGRKL